MILQTTRIRALTDEQVTVLQLCLAGVPLLPSGETYEVFRRNGWLTKTSALSKLGRWAAAKTLDDCALCGGECRTPWWNRRGEYFCSRYHRERSNAMLRRLQTATPPPAAAECIERLAGTGFYVGLGKAQMDHRLSGAAFPTE